MSPTPPPPGRPPAGTGRGTRVAILVLIVTGALLLGFGVTLVAVAAIGGPTPPGLAAAPTSDRGFAVWATNDDGTPVRWDPCRPVEVVLNPAGAPDTAGEDLVVALDRVAKASGLALELLGTTDEPASGTRLPFQPERYGDRWAPVLVTWVDPSSPGLALRDSDRGLAEPVAVGPGGSQVFVSGQILLNARRTDLRGGFDERADSWGATLVHELLHLIGLEHVDDPDELMYTFPGQGPVRFGPGDQAGLAAIGAEQGCVEVPDPGPVRVRPATGR